MEAESLKLRSEKMYQAELFQGDSGPGSVRIEIKPVGNEGIGKFLKSFLTFFCKIFLDNFMDSFWNNFLEGCFELKQISRKTFDTFQSCFNSASF